MSENHIEINIKNQTLTLISSNMNLEFPVSSAQNGIGQLLGSGCTPLGIHYVRAKVGFDLPINSVFVARRPTGEIYSPELSKSYPERDWILTRILWLCGKERGFNRLGNVDSMQRFIYIHGTPDSEPMGVPLSHGCIRMRNHDIIKLFDLTPIGTVVTICS